MPSGLHRAAATFQQLMNQILSSHHSYIDMYINYIVVYSAGWEEHLQHLTSMLRALGDTGLTANPAKCHLGQWEVTYLGYTLGKRKLRSLIEKEQALRDYPTPTTKRHVWQFLGLAEYYHHFVPKFATLAAPLIDLTKNFQPQKIQWSEDCEATFQAL